MGRRIFLAQATDGGDRSPNAVPMANETQERRGRRWSDGLIFALFALLCTLVVFSLTLGRYPVSIPEIIRVLFTTNPLHATGSNADPAWVVVEIVRIPRVLIVTLCGMGLALSGASMQGVFRNPLVGRKLLVFRRVHHSAEYSR